LCRRRHNHQYADLIVMPTRPGEALQSANSAVRNIGIIPLHFKGPLGARCEAAKTVSRDRLEVWLCTRDAVNRVRGSGFTAWAVDRPNRRGVGPYWLFRPTSRGRRDREPRRVMPTPTGDQPKLPGLPRPRRLNDGVGILVLVPTSAQPPVAPCSCRRDVRNATLSYRGVLARELTAKDARLYMRARQVRRSRWSTSDDGVASGV
jgi:hypothetical protein